MSPTSGWQVGRESSWRRVNRKAVTVAIDPRVLQTFDEASNSWKLAAGEYEVSPEHLQTVHRSQGAS